MPTAEAAWKELAALAPGLVVRDTTSDEKGKSLSELYPKAVRASKVVDLFGHKSDGHKKKPPSKPAVRPKPGDDEPPPGAA